jgi:hypothetical protein
MDVIYREHKECNGIKRIVQLHSQECNGTYAIALLRNGIFYSISCDHQGFFQGFFRVVKRPQKLNLELSFETQSSHQSFSEVKMKLFELNS